MTVPIFPTESSYLMLTSARVTHRLSLKAQFRIIALSFRKILKRILNIRVLISYRISQMFLKFLLEVLLILLK